MLPSLVRARSLGSVLRAIVRFSTDAVGSEYIPQRNDAHGCVDIGAADHQQHLELCCAQALERQIERTKWAILLAILKLPLLG